MCKSTHFFAYTPEAEKDNNFKDFKTTFEGSVATLDFYKGIINNVPRGSAAALALLGIIGTAVGGPTVSFVIHLLTIGIPAVSAGVVLLTRPAEEKAAATTDKLIEDGNQMKFFALAPDVDLKDPNAKEKEQIIVQNDAIKHRVFGAKH